MPRSVSGNYTLPLPPVTPNTVIETAWANPTMDDIAAAITDSLSRTGQGGMIAPFRLVDGTEAQPAWSFAAETGTGMWRDSAGVMGLAIQSAGIQAWTANGSTVNGDFAVTGDLDVVGLLTVGGLPVDPSTYVLKTGDTMIGPLAIGVDATDPVPLVLRSEHPDGTFAAWLTVGGTPRGYIGAGGALFAAAALSDFGIRSEGKLVFGGPTGAVLGNWTGTGLSIGQGLTASAGGAIDMFGSFMHLFNADYNAYLGTGTLITGGAVSTFAIRAAGAIAFSPNAGANRAFTIFADGNVSVGANADAYGRVTAIPAANPTTALGANQFTAGENSNNAGFRMQMGFALLGGSVWAGQLQAVADNLGAALYLNMDGGAVYYGTTPAGFDSTPEIGFRTLQPRYVSGGHTLNGNDRGRSIILTGAGDITVPSGTFSPGDVFTIYNTIGGPEDIVQGGGLTLRWAGVSASGASRVLAHNGICTIYFINSTVATISGVGLT